MRSKPVQIRAELNENAKVGLKIVSEMCIEEWKIGYSGIDFAVTKDSDQPACLEVVISVFIVSLQNLYRIQWQTA